LWQELGGQSFWLRARLGKMHTPENLLGPDLLLLQAGPPQRKYLGTARGNDDIPRKN
jgi:hypothetical protein